jgi:hypothetical protein
MKAAFGSVFHHLGVWSRERILKDMIEGDPSDLNVVWISQSRELEFRTVSKPVLR